MCAIPLPPADQVQFLLGLCKRKDAEIATLRADLATLEEPRPFAREDIRKLVRKLPSSCELHCVEFDGAHTDRKAVLAELYRAAGVEDA